MDKEAKAHLDELGEIVGDGSVDWVDDETESEEGQDTSGIPLVSWVSEKCIRSVVLGLLGVYVEDASGPLKKVCFFAPIIFLVTDDRSDLESPDCPKGDQDQFCKHD